VSYVRKKKNFKHDLKLISEEASKVISELSNLGKTLVETGGDQTKDVKENLDSFVSEQIDNLKESLKSMQSMITENAKVADEHIRTNPYWYILGTLGLGFVLGKVLAQYSRK
jgi:ElaB/YqjD/DUF883 family membrane-anchored ribosome-binding protein